jgi:UDP-glucose 4-epimerase
MKKYGSMRLLITGGAGCLGSNLIEMLLPRGYEIMVIDNFATGKREVLGPVAGLTVVEGTIANDLLVRDVFARFRPTHVIHSAAAYKDPQNWAEDIATNVLGTTNVTRAALEFGVGRLVNFQTALCYGRPLQLPIPVDHACAPFTSYGISKTAGEQYIAQSGIKFVSLRLANVCGPRLAIGPIPTFYKRLKNGQSCFCSDTVRDFLDMSDFLQLMELVLEEDAPTGTFNVSSGEGHTILEIYQAVARYLAIEPPDVPVVPAAADDVHAVVLDPGKTELAFGWRAQTSFEATIRNQLQWYDAYGVTDIVSHLSAPELVTR